MQLEHSFTVPVSVDEAWRVLLDIERIAPCMPGAALDSVSADGDDFTGTVKVRLGPIGLTYKGKASFVEKDEAAHRAVIDAQGRDTRGNGTASARVAATLHAADDGTRVDVVTDLNITGKPAQFGRGVMADVGNKLIGQFADCLAGRLAGSGAEPGSIQTAPRTEAARPTPTLTEPPGVAAEQSGTTPTPTGSAQTGSAQTGPTQTGPTPPEPAATAALTPAPAAQEPINLAAAAGPALAKRVAPVAGALLLAFLVIRRRRR